jgi:hypothetical protein
MVSQKKGNPSECDNLAEVTQRGFGETGKNPVFISWYFVARLRTAINVSQNENMMPAFFAVVCARLWEHTTAKMRAFFLFFWRSL